MEKNFAEVGKCFINVPNRKAMERMVYENEAKEPHIKFQGNMVKLEVLTKDDSIVYILPAEVLGKKEKEEKVVTQIIEAPKEEKPVAKTKKSKKAKEEPKVEVEATPVVEEEVDIKVVEEEMTRKAFPNKKTAIEWVMNEALDNFVAEGLQENGEYIIAYFEKDAKRSRFEALAVSLNENWTSKLPKIEGARFYVITADDLMYGFGKREMADYGNFRVYYEPATERIEVETTWSNQAVSKDWIANIAAAFVVADNYNTMVTAVKKTIKDIK